MNLPASFFKTFTLTLGKFSLPVSYIQAGVIVLLLFILVLTMAQFRRHFIEWSFKGGIVGLFFGFLLALILEGFLIIGGKTALTEVLGWKNAPKPIQVALDSGRGKLVQVLGVQDEIPVSSAKENVTVESAVETLQSLNPTDMKKVKSLICQP
jgi:hypothetical protein